MTSKAVARARAVARRYLTIGSLDALVRTVESPALDEQWKPLAMTA